MLKRPVLFYLVESNLIIVNKFNYSQTKKIVLECVLEGNDLNANRKFTED